MKGSFVALTVSDIIALTLAFLGLIGTGSMLIMNLKIRTAMQAQQVAFDGRFTSVELKVEGARLELSREHAKLELQIANFRTKVAEDQSLLLGKIMADMQERFTNRGASEAMHQANSQRLDAIDDRLERIEQKVNL